MFWVLHVMFSHLIAYLSLSYSEENEDGNYQSIDNNDNLRSNVRLATSSRVK